VKHALVAPGVFFISVMAIGTDFPKEQIKERF
jgi:hypothetical protein